MNLEYKHGNRTFWYCGYYMSTVLRKYYVTHKTNYKEDLANDQITTKEYYNPLKE